MRCKAFIDLHVHLREPGFEYKEDIESGSHAAIAGGYGAIFCMANTNPVNDNVEVTRHIKKRGKEIGLVEIYPVAAISKGLKGKELVDFEALRKESVIAFSDDGKGLQDASLMQRALEIAKDLDVMIISHAEDEGKSDLREREDSMIMRDIELAGKTGARLHIAHVSTKDGVEMVRRAKEAGHNVTCEATPHHLLISTPSPLAGEGRGEGYINPNFIMNPPLRSEKDRLALIAGLKDGTIDAIATDHAPHAEWEKNIPSGGVIPPGVIGMETAFPVCLKLVDEGHITLERLVELFTTGPARVAKIEPPKKIFKWNLKAEYVIDSSKFFSKGRNCPFDGWKVRGKNIIERMLCTTTK